jgi:hypothetical protein
MGTSTYLAFSLLLRSVVVDHLLGISLAVSSAVGRASISGVSIYLTPGILKA